MMNILNNITIIIIAAAFAICSAVLFKEYVQKCLVQMLPLPDNNQN